MSKRKNIYHAEFFKTLEDAKFFQHKLGGGAIVKNVKYSHSKHEFWVEAMVHNDYDPHNKAWYEDRPYCVAWNTFATIDDEGVVHYEG